MLHESLEANSFALVRRLADDLSHEIKNPLHAMVINLELVRRRIAAGDDDAAFERLAVVEAEIHRVHALVDTYLRLLRPGIEPSGPFELDALVTELLPLFEAEAKVARVEFDFEGHAAGAHVHGDRSALKQLLLTLFLATADTLAEGRGRIDLRSAPDDVSVHLTLHGSGSQRRDAPDHRVPAAIALAEAAGGVLQFRSAQQGSTWLLRLSR